MHLNSEEMFTNPILSSPAPIYEHSLTSNYNFRSGLNSNRKKYDKRSPDQLIKQAKIRMNDHQLYNQVVDKSFGTYESVEQRDFNHKRVSDS